MLIQITAPYFCACILDGEPAPIIRYMKGWNLGSVRNYCKKKNWSVTIIEEPMAEFIRGTVQYVPEPRQFTKNGKTTLYYSIKVNDTYYSTGSKVPPQEGTLIEFEAEKNAKGYWDVTKSGIKVIQPELPSQNVAAAAVSAAKTSHMSKDDYWRRKEDRDLLKEAEWAAKDKRIELQSCRNSAIELVKLLITPIATAEGPVAIVKLPAKAKQVEFIEKLVAQYTEQFVTDNNNIKNEKNDQAEVEPEVPVSGPVDQPDDESGWDA